MKSTFLILHFFILGFHAVLRVGAECGRSEYLSAAGECCPMCSKGAVIHKDCNGDYSTICEPCSTGTFMNEPNDLHNCFLCKICDIGLYIKRNCTTVENTVCEVLDGYYCLDTECSLVWKHSVCKPGQRIKAPGTKASDTVCEPCPPRFYSAEGVNCSKWTDCSVNDENEDQEGTSVRDVKCKTRRKRHGLIAALALTATVILLLVIVSYLKPRKTKKGSTVLNTPVEETSPPSSGSALSSSSGATPIVLS